MNTRIILIIIIFISPLLIFGQTWDYPVKPGTDEWKALNSNKEKVDVCQLPENILIQTSTKDLFEICFKYPLLKDFFAFNDVYIGIKKLFNDFNGIRELYNRPDILDVLLQKNEEILENRYLLEGNYPLIAKGDYIISISIMEILLSIPEFQEKLSPNDQKNILKSLMKNYELKRSEPQYFKGIGFETNILSRAKTIGVIENTAVKSNEVYSADFINKIDAKSSEYLKNE